MILRPPSLERVNAMFLEHEIAMVGGVTREQCSGGVRSVVLLGNEVFSSFPQFLGVSGLGVLGDNRWWGGSGGVLPVEDLVGGEVGAVGFFLWGTLSKVEAVLFFLWGTSSEVVCGTSQTSLGETFFAQLSGGGDGAKK